MFLAVYRNSLVTRVNASSAKKKWRMRTNIPSALLELAAKERTLSKNIQNVITQKRSKLSMRRLILFGFELHVNSRPLGKSHVRDTPLISDRDWDCYPLENTLQTTGIGVKKGHFTKESTVKGKGRISVVNLIWTWIRPTGKLWALMVNLNCGQTVILHNYLCTWAKNNVFCFQV